MAMATNDRTRFGLKPSLFRRASIPKDINLFRIFSFGDHVSLRIISLFNSIVLKFLNYIHRPSIVVHCRYPRSVGCSNSWISRHRKALDQSERKKTALVGFNLGEKQSCSRVVYYYFIAYVSIALAVSVS